MKLLYELAAKYHHLTNHRMKLLGLMTPRYLGRVASFINQSRDMDYRQAEGLVEEQAERFEAQKDYLVRLWSNGDSPKALEEELSREK